MTAKKHIFKKICIILGSILFVAGCALFVFGMSKENWDFNKLSTVNYQTKTYIQGEEEISSLRIDFENADIDLSVSSQTDKITVEYPQRVDPNGKEINSVKITTTGGQLQIIEPEQKFELIAWNFKTPKVKIVLPDTVLNTISLNTENGDISVKGAALSLSLNVESDNGDIRISDVIAENGITLATDNGDIFLSTLKTNELKLETENGDILSGTGNIDASIILAETDNGDVKLNLTGKQTDYAISAHTHLGSCNVSNSSEGNRKLTVRTDLGDIKIYFSESV